ncbi:MAG: site-specific integrase [Ignavibacteriaceae bacterium]|nr:site-specific integrase [Ignavibacteriaceae bacterium]
MAIYSRCCGKDYLSSKRKCDICNKFLAKYVVKMQDPATGRWKTKTVPNLKLAKDIEAKFKTEAIEGKLLDKKEIGDISFDRFLEYAKLHRKTWKNDQGRWNIHVKDKDFMTKKGINNILGQMKKNGKSDCTIHHVLKLIKRVFNWHIQNEYYFQVNPCNGIKAPSYDNKATTFLSIEEIDKLIVDLEGWDNFRATNIILFALYTGRRKSEITNLEWPHVDMFNKTITCMKTKNGKNLSFPLCEKAYQILLKAHEQKISKYVFPSSSGHIYYNGFSLAWQRLKNRIGLKCRFHDLRHTYASHLASSGKVGLYEIKTLLGHSDLSLTQRYAHLTNEAVRMATCVIDDIF